MKKESMTGIELIAQERKRQTEEENWSPEHDAHHTKDEIALAAACYITPSDYLKFSPKGVFEYNLDFNIPELWPWEKEWYKPAPDRKKESRIRELVKGGALVAAEIDRLLNKPSEELKAPTTADKIYDGEDELANSPNAISVYDRHMEPGYFNTTRYLHPREVRELIDNIGKSELKQLWFDPKEPS